ncbi:hypothetical protein ACFFGH_18300 [Lysobacter korlensis]|uniref:Secreted protein n=1 Tax=Lysobacter korlensis TaxID=553636 RepID=A0ABV6RS57_9GAMM
MRFLNPAASVLAAPIVALSLFAAPAVQAHPVEGSIHTVSRHGDPLLWGSVNAINGEVYMAGGPTRAPDCDNGVLKDGSYYYQVTDRRTGRLITAQPITSRRFEVQGGLIRNPRWSDGDETDCGSHTIAMPTRSPYTPKNPNMLIAVTRVSDYERICGRGVDCGARGFESKRTFWRRYQMRTDNVGIAEITAFRFYDANANARYDKDEVDMPEWIALLTADHMDRYEQFDEFGLIQVKVLPGRYAMGIVDGRHGYPWHETATLTKGHDGSPGYVRFELKPNEKRTIAYGAYCVVPTGQDPWYWREGEGATLVDAQDLAALRSLNLRNTDGSHFDPWSLNDYSVWVSIDRGSLSKELSVAIGSMTLSIRNGFSNPMSPIMPIRSSLGDLLSAANTSLAADGDARPGDAEYATQSRLQPAIANLPDSNFEGTTGVLPATPCAPDIPF